MTAVGFQCVVPAANPAVFQQPDLQVLADGPAVEGGEHRAYGEIVGGGVGEIGRYGVDDGA